MTQQGFILEIRNGSGRLVFVGYPDAEKHARSHALRTEMSRQGVPTTATPAEPMRHGNDRVNASGAR